MRWKSGRRSRNVEDRRGNSAPMGLAGAGGAGVLFRIVPFLLRSKIGRTVLIVGVVGVFGAKMVGIDVMPLLLGGGMSNSAAPSAARFSATDQQLSEFVSVVLADTEDTWDALFKQMNMHYKQPTLVLFSGVVSSACGRAEAAMGPFYCPGDQKVYIDLSFYQDLKNRHQAPGDFAQAYVIAHEVGHHVQTLLGISNKVREQKSRLSKEQGNVLSVKQELQADCFAGLWAHSANTERKIVEEGDLEEALVAASAIGDDRLQKQSKGYVVPESFTHGTSAQRVRWFRKGFQTGDIRQCDTFSAVSI